MNTEMNNTKLDYEVVDQITTAVANDNTVKVELYLIEEYAPKMHLAIQFTEPTVEKAGWVKTFIKWSDSEKMQPVLIRRAACCLSALGHIGSPCGLCGYNKEADPVKDDAQETQGDEKA